MISGNDENGDPIENWCNADPKDKHVGLCYLCSESVSVALRGSLLLLFLILLLFLYLINCRLGRDSLMRHSSKLNHKEFARKNRDSGGRLKIIVPKQFIVDCIQKGSSSNDLTFKEKVLDEKTG